MKKLLIDRIRENHPGLTTVEASKAIDIVFAGVRNALEGGAPYIVVPGFGTFRRKLRDTRTVRNPKTGETSTKMAHFVITFREARGK